MNLRNNLEAGRDLEHGLEQLKLAIEGLSGTLDNVEDQVHKSSLDAFFTHLSNDLTNEDAFDHTHS